MRSHDRRVTAASITQTPAPRTIPFDGQTRADPIPVPPVEFGRPEPEQLFREVLRIERKFGAFPAWVDFTRPERNRAGATPHDESPFLLPCAKSINPNLGPTSAWESPV